MLWVTTMKTRNKATIEDLYRYKGKAELVNGEIVPMSPTGRGPSYAASEIFVSLRAYARRTKFGQAYNDNVGFLSNLLSRKSFSPDVAFDTQPLTAVDMEYVDHAPIFAVEVRSHGDYGPAKDKEIAQKRADYFAAGTQVVWDVDLLSEDIVRVYRSDDSAKPVIYRRGENAEAEPALPGWTFPVNNLFPDTQA
jgi:Uma2 family endonuclease